MDDPRRGAPGVHVTKFTAFAPHAARAQARCLFTHRACRDRHPTDGLA
jgi:hypothetical protein